MKAIFPILFLFLASSAIFCQDPLPMEIPDQPVEETSGNMNAAPSGYAYNAYGDLITANQNYWRKRGSNYAKSYYENGKYGMRAQDGTILIPAQYDQLYFAYGGFMIAVKDGLTGVINEANKVIIPFEYYSLQIIFTNYFNHIPDPSVSRDELRLVAQKEKGQYGIIDGNGRVISPFRESKMMQVQYFYEAPRNDRGTITTPPQDYQKALDGSALIFRFKGAGVLSGRGDTILPFVYEDVFPLYKTNNPAWIQVEEDGKYGLYDLGKGWVFPTEYAGEFGLLHLLTEDGAPFYPTLFIAHKVVGETAYNNPLTKAGLIDSTGREVLPFEYEGFGTSFTFDDNRHFVAKKDGKWGLVNANSEVIIPFTYPKFLRKYNLGGKIVFSLKDSTDAFYGLLSSENKMLVPYKYKWFDECNGQLLEFLAEDGQSGLLNVKGEEVVKGDYSAFALLRYGYFQSVNKEGLNGIVSPTGEILLEPTFKGVYPEELIPGFSTALKKADIEEEEVVAILTKGDKVFAFLKGGGLVELE
ncbi:MAG: WG repeat-containing protein [Bacteroidetes bacterium]|nr:WG repeat-containing protein [Bacteroidota bacterium]